MMASTEMVGRDSESAELENLLDALRAGPAGLGIEGGPGIGKTTLWRHAVQLARERGYIVLTTAPREPDAPLAFAGLGDLADDMPDGALDQLSGRQRRALAAALYLDEAATPDEYALPRAVLNVLRRLASEAPVLVAVDDEQWLDRPSARLLAFACRRLRDGPVGVLLARRLASSGALWPELERDFATGGLKRMLVRPLDLSTTRRLLAKHVIGRISPPLLRRIHAASGGNPLYALTIARALETRDAFGIDSGDLPIPVTLTEAIDRRLDELDPRALEPLLVIAATADPTVALIQAILPAFRMSDLECAQRADILEIAGDRVAFTHPLLASASYARAAPARRREVHRLVADVARDVEQRAHHLALGAEAPDRQLALTLEQAAELAARRGAPEAAAELLEHAFRLTPAEAASARRSRAISAAEQHLASADLARARSVLEDVLRDLPSGAIRARGLLLLARVRKDDFQAATSLCEQALAEARGHQRVSAQIHHQLVELCSNQGDQSAALDHAAAAVEAAEHARDRGLLAQMLASAATAAFFAGQPRDPDRDSRALELERYAHDVPSYYVPSAAIGLHLLWSDQVDEARPLLKRALHRAEHRGEEAARLGLVFHLAHLEWEAGSRERAQTYTTELTEATPQLEDDQAESYLLWLQAFIAIRHGDLDAAAARAHEAIAVAGRIGDEFIAAFSTAILGIADLATGNPAAAHARVAPLREALVGGSAGFVGSLTLPFWTCDVEAFIALDQLDEAHQVLEHLFERAAAAGNPNALAVAHRSHALLLSAAGDTPAGLAALKQALTHHALRPLPFELGRTLLEKGALERRTRQKGAAKRSLEEAIATLEPLDAGMLLAKARDELSRVGLRRPSTKGPLTVVQARIAELVAAGMTNREIAATLYMSLRTVESHLTRVYREFGVRSRSQLTAALLAQSVTPSGAAHSPVHRALMFTDIVKSTDLLSAIGDDAWLRLRAWHDRALRELFAAHAGEEVSHTGDGFFVAFTDVAAAVRCAIAIQRTLDQHRYQQGFAPSVRIGLHYARTTQTPDGYAGLGVHQAARIVGLANAAEIVASADALAHAGLDLVADNRRRVSLKGVREAVEVATIVWQTGPAEARHKLELAGTGATAKRPGDGPPGADADAAR